MVDHTPTREQLLHLRYEAAELEHSLMCTYLYAAFSMKDERSVDPETDGPLQVRGNLEITSGTGRVVARLVQAKLCRCGGSGTKPFCDGTHAKNGFRSD